MGPVPDLYIAVAFLGRFDTGNTDRAAGGIAAPQRALRSLQDLDPFHVEHLRTAVDIGRLVYAVHVHGRRGWRRCREIIDAHAANGKQRRGAVLHVDRHAGSQVGEVCRIGHTQRPHLRIGERTDRDTHVLGVLLAFLRGDDDFFQQRGGCRLREKD